MGEFDQLFKGLGIPEKTYLYRRANLFNVDAATGLSYGANYYLDGNNDRAVGDFTFAIQYSPQNHILYLMRGIIYEKIENYIEAEKDFHTVLEIMPNEYIAAYHLGMIYFIRKEYERAVKWLQVSYDNAVDDDLEDLYNLNDKFIFVSKQRIANDLDNAFLQLGSNRQQHSGFSTMEKIRNLVDNELLNKIDSLDGFSIFKYDDQKYDIYLPTNTKENFYFITYENGSYFDLNSNQISQLEIATCKYPTGEIIEKNYKKIPIYSEIYIKEHSRLNFDGYDSPVETGAEELLNLGFEAFEAEDYVQALQYYNSAIALKPYDDSLYNKRIDCYIKIKQYYAAIDDLCRAGIANPISKQNIFTFTYEEIGNIYRLANDYTNAIKYYTFTVLHTNQWWLYQYRAMCYAEIGAYTLAIQDFESILKTERKIQILLRLGEVYAKVGLISEATSMLNEVVNFPLKGDKPWIRLLEEQAYKPFKEKANRFLDEYC